jgi:magnesium chelatase family protein
MNPCPCGYHNIQKHKGKCKCLSSKIRNYQQKLSGPFLDRIDINLQIEPVEHAALTKSVSFAETSDEIRRRVNRAYKQQISRFVSYNITRNAEMNTSLIEKFCVLDKESKNMLHVAIDHVGLSARGYYRAIKMARTIADLDRQERIHSRHISEALQYLYRIKP